MALLSILDTTEVNVQLSPPLCHNLGCPQQRDLSAAVASSLGGEANALYPMLSDLYFLFDVCV